MDCNKEEATRAKDIAGVKMLGKDFVGAKKLLLKALNLSPDIENASHMLTVCEVHCSAGNLVNGQIDHYGILQVEVSADESFIRKQYRRLALLLHPDKNKFAGAEAAFKLVGEAYKVLSDQTNRQVYDAKRRVQVRTTWKPPQNARNARCYTATTFNPHNPFGLKQQDQQSASTFFPTQYFWTMCLFCNHRFQYSRSWLNKEVQCQKCFRKFMAFEVSLQNVPPPGLSSEFSWNRASFQGPAIPTQFAYNHTGQQTYPPQSSNPVGTTNNGYDSRSKEETHDSSVHGMCGNPDTKSLKEPSVKPSSGDAKKKRSRRVVDSSDSDSAESDSSDSDIILEVDPPVLDGSSTSNRYPRRSNRPKAKYTFKDAESEDDVDVVLPRRRLRKADSSSWKDTNISAPEVVINGKTSETSISEKYEKQDKPTSDVNSAVGSRSMMSQGTIFVSYPDSEFCDFDKERDQSKFAVNQIWAVYDDVDGMPRYYALIQKVCTRNFKLQYVWLESLPTSPAEKVWVKAGLPSACGSFKLGQTGSSKNLEMFSHVIYAKSLENTYYIYPKKGEIWALFKNWDIGWSSAVQKPKNFVYEFVKVISDFAYGKDISVSYLDKVKGFRYLFTTSSDKGTTVMSSAQLLKFSHCIPYHKVNEDREGVPKDSFEFDPAALPESLVNGIDDPAIAEDKVRGGPGNNESCKQSQNAFEQGDNAPYCAENRSGEPHKQVPSSLVTEKNEEQPENSNSDEKEYPSSEFYDFRDIGHLFKQGQIWALYCNVDEYPKFYAWIKKVDWGVSRISYKWLELHPVTEQEKLWSENGLPFGCGRFKVVSGIETSNTTDQFSHMVTATPIKRNDLYDIYPNHGEVWAVYKNWNVNWTVENIKDSAAFTLVEIILRDEHVIKAVPLTKVKGYNSVFMPEIGGAGNIEMPLNECLKFSHQIPAHRITDQNFGKLRGFLELDPESTPKNFYEEDV